MNIFKKKQTITPKWRTVYPPNKTAEDFKRITRPKPNNTSAEIIGIKSTYEPSDRPDMNTWFEIVNFSGKYEQTLLMKMWDELKVKIHQNADNYETLKRNPPEKLTIPMSVKIYNFLNRHL